MNKPQPLPEPAVTCVVEVLLSGLIDYAGFFPPAGLSVVQSLATYREARSSPAAWLLGKLVLPAAQLPELEQRLKLDATATAADEPATAADEPLRISAVVPAVAADASAFHHGLEAIAQFNHSAEGWAVVDSIECKVDDQEQWDFASRACDDLPVQRFWELDPNAALESLLSKLAEANRTRTVAGDERQPARGRPWTEAAKIRTGGVVPTAIPDRARVARFIAACARHGVPFKATAGLHHPLPAVYPLTYAPDAPCGLMHGFLNVFLAATAAWTGPVSEEQLIDIMAVSAGEDWERQAETIRWRDLCWTAADIAATRREFAISFGSCSFAEPVHDLQSLAWLPGHQESASA